MKMTMAKAKVIGALLSFPAHEEVLAADVVARAGLPSGTAYPILNALAEEGLVSKLENWGSTRKTYCIVGPERWRTLREIMDNYALTTPGLTFQPASQDLQIREPRELLGRSVRQVWVEWAHEQPDPKPSWLLPWEDLDEGQREVDMRIGDALFAAGRTAGYEYGRADAEAELEKYRHRFGPLGEKEG
jgi:DNA-binding PadR family transcriptional regulator